MSNEHDLMTAPEELLQPTDLEGGIPPTYAPGNVDEIGDPILAVPRAKEKFYGPVSGPFAVKTRDDILQVGEEWTGYIRIDHAGDAFPVHEKAFARVYEELEGDRAVSDDVVDGLTSDLAKANRDLEESEATVTALRAELAAARADLDQAEEAAEGAAGPGAVSDAEASEAIGIEQADRYDEDSEREAAEHALAERGELDDLEESEDDEALIQPDDEPE